jgi:DNA repair protein RadC
MNQRYGNASIVHPREVYREAIKRSAASIIVIHNHPSGDPTPSQEDIHVTRRLTESGKMIGIELLDHIIIGDCTFTSLREKGYIQ